MKLLEFSKTQMVSTWTWFFRQKMGVLKKINELHRFYDPLHYVLLFPFGTDGYHLDLKYPNKKDKNVSGMSYYKYLLQERSSDGNSGHNMLLHSRRLSQQYAVDQFSKIETSRMNWHRYNQKQLRADKYQGLVDSVNSSDDFAPGRRIVLSPSYYGSPRWYIEQFNDAMSIVRKFGKPDLFITFTCNPRWKEITDSLGPNEKPEDRPDLCVRVFHAKMRLLIKLLTKDQILGRVIAFTCMKEDQKRGLPHCHMLLIMHKDDKPRTPEDVDKIISAEIPDKEAFPEFFEIITQHMIHGPCGQLNPDRPCMEGQGSKETCSKSFPKKINNDGTTLSDNSYPNYLRRDAAHGGQTTTRTIKGKSYTIDNRWVVPYSPKLSKLFGAHVNVEIVVTVKAVKYLYKYITKGADKVLFAVGDNGVLDEISNFSTARYISATEAFWRIYGFEIMKRYPAVQKLALHLQDEEYVVFMDDEASDAVEKGPPVTTLTAYFELNQEDPEARTILYPDICQTYRFASGKWIKPLRNHSLARSASAPPSDTIGRIPIISLNPKQSELFYLRMLLYHVPGAKNYDDLKDVNGVQHASFKEACRAKGLLSDDRELDEIMEEGSNAQFSGQLRHLFGTILAHMTPQDPVGLWEKYKDALCEDIAISNGRNGLPDISDYSAGLLDIHSFLLSMGLHITNNFGIILPNIDTADVPTRPTETYDTDLLKSLAVDSYNKMTIEQKHIFETVTDSVANNFGKCFSLNAAGGTGKTFVLKALLADIRSKGITAFATAISGIAATLMTNGRTLHSKLKVPIDITDESTCDITSSSILATELRECQLLIIDEITMAKKQVFEAVDRTMRDIRGIDKMFGGATVVLSGDWRQILPIVKHGSEAEIVDACLKQSYIWKKIDELKLRKNMRLSMGNNTEEDSFAQYLLDIGEGKVQPVSAERPDFILIPEDLLLKENSLDDLCEFVYSNISEDHDKLNWLSERNILSVTNESSDRVNDHVLTNFPSPDNIRLSADVILDENLARCYPQEFLNSLTPSGMPPHRLNLKCGSPVMLLRNLDTARGHCNGTRYIINQCHQHIIEATVISGMNIGAKKLIPRIPITCTDKNLPFTFRRTQFPVKTCFGMTINKSQGQSIKRVGLHLDQDVFAHGQLYVAMSRVTDRKNLRILYPADNDKTLRNVVYKEVL